MTTKIYFDLSDDILAVLSDNAITLEQILENEGIQAQFTYGLLPSSEDSSAKTKNLVEIATLVAASGGLIVSLAYAISKTLNTIYNKPQVVSFYEREEIRGADGNVLLDENGKPIFKTNKKYEMLESRQKAGKEIIEFKSGLIDGIVIKFETVNE